MLAPLLTAAALLASADAAFLPIARTTSNTCAAVDIDLFLSGSLLWPFSTNYGRLKSCVCIDTLDQYLRIDSVTRAAVDVVGLATVRSFVGTALRASSRRPGSCFIPQGFSCVPCSLKTGGGDSLVVAADSSLTTGLNLGSLLKGNALKADTSLSSTSDLRVGTSTGATLDTTLDANTSLDLGTNVDLAANGNTNTGLSSSSNLVVDSKTNANLGSTTDLKTDLKAAVDIDANVNANTNVHSGSSVVVGSNAVVTGGAVVSV